jgi:hypothetical protein
LVVMVPSDSILFAMSATADSYRTCLSTLVAVVVSSGAYFGMRSRPQM